MLCVVSSLFYSTGKSTRIRKIDLTTIQLKPEEYQTARKLYYYLCQISCLFNWSYSLVFCSLQIIIISARLELIFPRAWTEGVADGRRGGIRCDLARESCVAAL